MEAKELRIRNLVSDCGVIYMIDTIDNETKFCHVITRQGNRLVVSLDMIKPVTITEDMLLKLNAKKTFFTHLASYHFGSEEKPTYKNFRLEYVKLFNKGTGSTTKEGYFACYISNKFWKYIFDLHDLQNTLFALTGEELDVSPLIG